VDVIGQDTSVSSNTVLSFTVPAADRRVAVETAQAFTDD
jgi:hypothetical protein